MSDYEPSIGQEERIKFAEKYLLISRRTFWGTRENSSQSQARQAANLIYGANVMQSTDQNGRRIFDVWARIKHDSGLYVYTVDFASPDQVSQFDEEQKSLSVALSNAFDGGFGRVKLVPDRLDELANFRLR